jgi:IS30 family transposase
MQFVINAEQRCQDAIASMPFDQQVETARINYTHLTQEERYQIYALKKAGLKQSEIACGFESSSCTICRELDRNRSGKGYRPKQTRTMSEVL